MKNKFLKAAELRDRIGSDLGRKLGVEGFTFIKSNNWFTRIIGGYEEFFYLLIHSRRDHFAIEPYIFIKSTKVEKLLKSLIGNTTGLTMGNSIGYIYNSPDGRKIVNNNMEIKLFEYADLESAFETMGMYYDTIARPFFDKFCDLVAMDEIFNGPPFNHNPAYVGGMFADRLMRGLIIAKLVHNPNYEKLELVYNEAIKKTMREQSIADFEKVLEYLRYNRLD